MMTIEEARAILDRRAIEERQDQSWSNDLGRSVRFTRAHGVGITTMGWPATLEDERAAWRAELATENKARLDAEISKAVAARNAVWDRLAALDAAGVTEEFARRGGKLTSPIEDIVSFSAGRTVARLAAAGRVTQRLLIDWSEDGEVKAVRKARLGDEDFDSYGYSVDDGVVKMPTTYDKSWCAKVINPAAPKPDYAFLDRCPGGYILPDLEPGDVLVWGGRDKKGRKEGPFDKLVYEVTDTMVRAIGCDYATARKLRKLIIA